MPICPICAAKLAGSYSGYREHIKRYHAIVTPALQLKVAPVNSTGRSKAEIVEAMEQRLAKHIIDPHAKEHTDDCRCNLCFQTKLDALVTKTEEAANDCDRQAGALGNPDCD